MSIEEKVIKDRLNTSQIQSWGLGIVGAFVGGVAGWLLCSLMHQNGFYALALPGAGIGLGFALLSKRPMISGGVFCAVAAFAVSIFWEGINRPFVVDDSLSYFFANLHELTPPTWLFVGLGTVLAYWFGQGR
jgi:hypothetical protein